MSPTEKNAVCAAPMTWMSAVRRRPACCDAHIGTIFYRQAAWRRGRASLRLFRSNGRASSAKSGNWKVSLWTQWSDALIPIAVAECALGRLASLVEATCDLSSLLATCSHRACLPALPAFPSGLNPIPASNAIPICICRDAQGEHRR